MKKRLDLLVLERGLAESREKAKTLIMAGQVYVDQQKADKPGDLYPEDAQIEARGKALPFVSRGGLKLEKARREFQLSLEGLTCMDVGGLHRRLYRLHAAKRGQKSVRRGRGVRAAGLVPAQRPAGGEHRAHQRPVPHPGTGARGHRLFLRGRVLYLPFSDPSGGAPPFGGTGPGGVPDQTPV